MPFHFLFNSIGVAILYCFYNIVIADYVRTKDDKQAEIAFITMIVPLLVLSVGAFAIVWLLNYVGAIVWYQTPAYYVVGWIPAFLVLLLLNLIYTIFFNYIKTK